MDNACTTLTDVVRSAHLLRIDGYCVTKALDSFCWIKSRWNVGGYEWGVHIQPSCRHTTNNCKPFVALKLILLSEGCSALNVKANLRCRLVDPTGTGDPSEEKNMSSIFNRTGDCSRPVFLVSSLELEASCYLKDDSFTVQCTITVLKDLAVEGILIDEQLPVPSSNLHQHLGGLLENKTSPFSCPARESFVAHKAILAARSPVLMAEFFGHMSEASSRLVVIEDMEAVVFKAMLHFIYTDTVPQLDRQEEEGATTMAQHLLVAADRYALDRLKMICEGKLLSFLTADTATTTLALAQQHNCTKLAVKCMEFMVRTFLR